MTSPAATGPSGALLEGHVGAQYLLSLLSGGEARGLPGVVVGRVAFQQAGFGHAMDDVIVTGHDPQGRPATLELQAKRTIAFTSSDKVFGDVVCLACRAAAKPEFKTTRYELAVAIARTSTRIEQYVQDVLRWAREYQSPNSFFGRLTQSGAAHQAMREFVEAFRGHMRTTGAVDDDAAVWQLLSHFQVLAFDFEQPGSMYAQLARERCALQLEPRDVGRAGELWDSLQQIALQVDAAGGDLNAIALRERLASERGYRLAGDRSLHGARLRLAETAQNTLADINSHVHGVTIDRSDYVAAALLALEQNRYLEIRGAGGVGKSAVLKALAERIGIESHVIVVAPHRIPGGGWAALQSRLGCDATARELLVDLAGDGGGTLFVDGLDRFDDPKQRTTIADLIRAAAQVPGFRVVVTARLDFDSDARAWLPAQALSDLGQALPLIIEELSENEIVQLRTADPALAALLRPAHPAEKLVRNLYRLDRLARSVGAEAAAPFSEAQMAWQWWKSGDSAEATGRLERCRFLQFLAVHSLATSAPMDTSTLSAEAVTSLVKSGSLRALSAVRIEPTHDVLRDWAIGCLLYEDAEQLDALTLSNPAPVRLVRGVELAARLFAEFGDEAARWRVLLDRVSRPGAHGSWRRAVLLALPRSERADEVLNRCLAALSADNAEALGDLVRAAITVDSQPAAVIWAAVGADTSKLTDDFVAPRGPTWPNLIIWSLALGDHLPHAVVPQIVDLYNRWCSALGGLDALSPLLVARLYAWLVEVEAKNHPRASRYEEWAAAKERPGLSMTTTQESDLRTVFLTWCKLRPADAESYLRAVADHPHRRVLFRQLLPFVGTAPYAAPHAVADLFLQVLLEGEEDEGGRLSERHDVYAAWDIEYFPASPARSPFFDLLQANKEEGLRLVHGVVAHAIRRRSRGRDPGSDRIVVPLPLGPRSFPWQRSYAWSRSLEQSVVASALMALEGWAHLSIERGEPVRVVLDDVLGPEGSSAAYLLVAVDVMLSHWPKTREYAWPFVASAELLAMDRERYSYDTMQSDGAFTSWVRPEPAGAVKLDDLQRRPSRRIPLDTALPDFGIHGPEDMREAMRRALRDEAMHLGAPDGESRGMADPRFAAMSALNQLDPEHYVPAGTNERGQPIVQYAPPADEAELLTEFRNRAQRGTAELVIRGQMMRALIEPPCPEELLEQAVRWATGGISPLQGTADDEQNWMELTRFIVAALVARDGALELKVVRADWAHELLVEAAARDPEDDSFAKQLPYNPAAIAAVGLLAECRDDSKLFDLRLLLQLGARRDTGMASVLRAELAAKRTLRPELSRSLVRLGLASAIYALPQCDDDKFDNVDDYRARYRALEEERKETDRSRIQGAVTAELCWVLGEGSEPNWPTLPDPRPPTARFGVSLGKSRLRHSRSLQPPREFTLSSTTAAPWLSLAVAFWRETHPDVLCALVRHCWPWTASANGVDFEPEESPGEQPLEWNNAYFAAALAAALSGGDEGVAEFVLHPLARLPEERFLNATEAVLHELDQLWLAGGAVSDSCAASIREALAKMLVATWSWRRLASKRSSSTSMDLAGAVAALFMGQHDFGRGPRCYVLPPGASRAYVLLPLLTQLTEHAAGSTFVAMAFLELLEVEPHTNQLAFMAQAVAAWWRVQDANTEFWIDHGIGRRLCNWLDKAVLGESSSPAALDSAELIGIMDVLAQCGTPLVSGLEGRLAERRKAGGR